MRGHPLRSPFLIGSAENRYPRGGASRSVSRPLLLFLALLLALPLVPLGLAGGAPHDDCDLGKDAPDTQGTAAWMHPHYCEGQVVSGDPADWYAFNSGDGYFGYEVFAESGVTICIIFDDGYSRCDRGYQSMAVVFQGGFWLRMTGQGRYNMSVQIDGQRAPVVRQLECTPRVISPGSTVSCTLNAMDDSRGVRYRVQWGDGSESWAPSPSTYVWPDTPVQVSHTYINKGELKVQVTVYDQPHLSFHPTYTTAASTIIHVQDPAIGGTRVVASYEGGTGDVACLFGTGCVYLNAVPGEKTLEISLDDEMPWRVGGYVCAVESCDEGDVHAFCGSTTVALTGRDARVVVRLDEAFGPLDCGAGVGVAYKGTLTATFRTG